MSETAVIEQPKSEVLDGPPAVRNGNGHGAAIAAWDPSGNPLELVKLAIERGTDPEKLNRLIDLAERIEAGRAKAAFAAAMADCQAEMPPLPRTKKGATGKYAPFEVLNELIRPVYTKHGFSLSFSEGESSIDGLIRLVLTVDHRSGGTKDYWADFPPDGTGMKGNANKTPIDAKNSTITRGRRSLVKMAFNLAEVDEEESAPVDQAPAVPAGSVPMMNDAQRRRIDQLVTGMGIKPEYFSQRLTQLVGKSNWLELTAMEAAQVLANLERALRSALQQVAGKVADMNISAEERERLRRRTDELSALMTS